jgi:hypothetical protein
MKHRENGLHRFIVIVATVLVFTGPAFGQANCGHANHHPAPRGTSLAATRTVDAEGTPMPGGGTTPDPGVFNVPCRTFGYERPACSDGPCGTGRNWRPNSGKRVGTDLASAATIRSLKTWLRIRIPGQLDERSAGDALNCVGCYSSKDLHLGLLGLDRAQCHATNNWTVAGFQYPSPRSTDCAQCHQALPSHYMMHFNMISKKIARQEVAQVSGCCGTTSRALGTTSITDVEENLGL